MVVYSHYPEDTRVRREANALVENGFDVDIICIKQMEQEAFEEFEGINIYRLNIKKTRGSLYGYIYLYFYFFLLSFIKVTSLFLKKKYDIVHVHNMPNFIVFSAIIPKLFGKKIILDMHDPSPEILRSLTNKDKNSILNKLAVLEEKLSVWFADQIITTNIAFKNLFVSRGYRSEKIKIVMNSPQTNIFNKIKTPNNIYQNHSSKKFRLMYNGTIIKRHGLDILVDVINSLKDKIPEIELNIFGDGEFLPEVLKKIEVLNLQKFIKYRGVFLVDKIAEEIPKMDIGVIPNRFNIFTNLNFPIRIFEFIHFKKPIIVPRTQGIKDYFSEDEIFYFNSENTNDLEHVISKIYNDPIFTSQVVEKGYSILKKHNWEVQSLELINLYNKILT